MDSMNDEEDGDFINSEDNQSQQPRVRVASLEKLVDYCAEEFSKSHVASAFVFLFCLRVCFFLTAIALLGDLFIFHKLLGNRSRLLYSGACFSKLLVTTGPVKLFCFPF